jgi:haloalkane dehalogenase
MSTSETNITMVRERRAAALPAIEARPAWISEELFPFRSRFIEIGEARLHYIDEGTGPTLLFLHGSPMWSFVFRHSIASLRSRFRCVAVDMPGLGLSTAPVVSGRAFEDNARYYQEFVRRLDLRNFVAIAHATAGPSCLRMATRERDRISGLVITTSLAWSPQEFPAMWRFVRVVSSRAFRLAVVRMNLLAWLSTRIGRSTGKFTAAERAAILGPYRNVAARRHLANLLYGLRVETPFFIQLETHLSELRDLPTLLMYGVKDHGYQAGFLERWKQVLPNNSVALMQKSGHFPQEDEPEAYTAELAGWLDAHFANGVRAASGH